MLYVHGIITYCTVIHQNKKYINAATKFRKTKYRSFRTVCNFTWISKFGWKKKNNPLICTADHLLVFYLIIKFVLWIVAE